MERENGGIPNGRGAENKNNWRDEEIHSFNVC